MAISIVDGVRSAVGAQNGGSMVHALTGTLSGDIVVIIATSDANGGFNLPTPATYNVQYDEDITGSNPGSCGVFWKRLTGAEAAPEITPLGGDECSSIAIAFRGCVATGNPFEVGPVFSIDSNLTTAFLLCGTFTPAADNCMIFACGGSSGSVSATDADPAEMTDFRQVFEFGSGGDALTAYCGEVQTTATERAGVGFNLSGTQNRNGVVFLSALLPAAAAGGLPPDGIGHRGSLGLGQIDGAMIG